MSALSGLLVAAGGGPAPFVLQIALCFVSAGALVLLCHRFQIPSIAGLILAGFLIGPSALGLIEDRSAIETIANLGLVFLLFLIGLEIDLRALRASGRTLLVTGLLQVPLSVAVGSLAFMGLLFLSPGLVPDAMAALYLGLAAAFSSTLLVVKTLQARLEVDTLDGRLCVGLLVFQDIWAIIVLTLQPNLDHPEWLPIVGTFLGVVALVLVAWFASRFVLAAGFATVAKFPEAIATLALGWCFALSVLGTQLGTVSHWLHLPFSMAVPMELGALIAGTAIASLPYTHEVVAKVGNLRDFFITLFFVALGMGIPIPGSFLPLAGAAAIVMVAILVRALVFAPLLASSGLPFRDAITVSTKLAQVSEFALVMTYVGLSLGHVQAELASLVIFAFVATAISTPFTFRVADPTARWVQRRLLGDRSATSASLVSDGHGAPRPRIVLLGLHRIASSLLHEVGRQYPDLIPELMIVDLNATLHAKARSTGATVLYADMANPETLTHTGLEHAEVIVCTIPDELLRGISNLELTRQLRRLAPDASLIMHTTELTHAQALYQAGADYVYSSRVETALGLVPALTSALNGGLADFRLRYEEGAHDLCDRKEVLP